MSSLSFSWKINVGHSTLLIILMLLIIPFILENCFNFEAEKAQLTLLGIQHISLLLLNTTGYF